MEEGMSILIRSIKEISENEVFKIQRKDFETPGNRAVKLAEFILQNCEENRDLRDFAVLISKFSLELLQLQTNKASAREILCTRLHHTCKNAEFKDKFFIVTSMYNTDDNTRMFLLNAIGKQFFQISLSWRNEQLINHEVKSIDTTLSNEEQTTLRYVAGFIPFSLSNRYKNKQNTELGKMVMETISSWRANSNETNEKSFLEFSKSWIDRVNRGGLFLVNDDFFIFIRRIENVARSVLNSNLISNYKGEDLRDVLMNKLKKSELVDIGWESLTKKLQCDETKQLLKEIILRKWVGIRAKSFMKCWIRLLHRKKQNISEKSEPSLRKTLHGKRKKDLTPSDRHDTSL